jgi:hypothetical protein
MKNIKTQNAATPATEPRLRKILVRPDRLEAQPDFPVTLPVCFGAAIAREYGVLPDVELVLDYPDDDKEERGVFTVNFKRVDGTVGDISRNYNPEAWGWAREMAFATPEKIAKFLLDDLRGTMSDRKK